MNYNEAIQVFKNRKAEIQKEIDALQEYRKSITKTEMDDCIKDYQDEIDAINFTITVMKNTCIRGEKFITMQGDSEIDYVIKALDYQQKDQHGEDGNPIHTIFKCGCLTVEFSTKMQKTIFGAVLDMRLEEGTMRTERDA